MHSKVKPLGISTLAKTSVILTVLGLACANVFAAATASDSASNYSTWGVGAANLGSGFGAWNIAINNNNNPPYAGAYLDNSSSAVAGSGGFSWATYANSATTLLPSVSVTRPFTSGNGSSSLVDQTFSVSLASAGVGPSQGDLSVGVGNAFLFDYLGSGPDNFTLSVDGGSPVAVTQVPFSALSAGINISLTVTGLANSTAENYLFSVSPVSGGSALYTTSGTFDSSSFNTSSFNYLDSNTTGNGYFNNLSIASVPEPSSMALFALSGLAALVAFRRRR